MLFMLGGVTIDTAPFSAESVSRSSSADIASKPIVGGPKAHEFMGVGDGTLTITGQILPLHIGGEPQLEALRTMCETGERFPVMRGDGTALGHHALTNVGDAHKTLASDGRGYVLVHTLSMIKVQFTESGAAGTVSKILQLFDALR